MSSANFGKQNEHDSFREGANASKFGPAEQPEKTSRPLGIKELGAYVLKAGEKQEKEQRHQYSHRPDHDHGRDRELSRRSVRERLREREAERENERERD